MFPPLRVTARRLRPGRHPWPGKPPSPDARFRARGTPAAEWWSALRPENRPASARTARESAVHELPRGARRAAEPPEGAPPETVRSPGSASPGPARPESAFGPELAVGERALVGGRSRGTPDARRSRRAVPRGSIGCRVPATRRRRPRAGQPPGPERADRIRPRPTEEAGLPSPPLLPGEAPPGPDGTVRRLARSPGRGPLRPRKSGRRKSLNICEEKR
jgi:hypothetical protein